ncbi:MAG TPA: cytochrome c [Burkholderiales bacterium]|nr:cytochrome c [Burkholderiales bacterium]
MKHSSIAVLMGAGIALAGGSTLAQQKPEDIIKYRQSALFIMGQHFGPLAGMAQNKIPYDKDAAMRHAAMVEFMSKLPWDRFAPGTDQGNTKAKPEIWLNLEDFKAKAEKMQGEVAKLAQVSKAGDFNALKAQVGETGKACKACHDEYRNK